MGDGADCTLHFQTSSFVKNGRVQHDIEDISTKGPMASSPLAWKKQRIIKMLWPWPKIVFFTLWHAPNSINDTKLGQKESNIWPETAESAQLMWRQLFHSPQKRVILGLAWIRQPGSRESCSPAERCCVYACGKLCEGSTRLSTRPEVLESQSRTFESKHLVSECVAWKRVQIPHSFKS